MSTSCWVAASRSPRWAMAASSLTSWMPPNHPGGRATHVASSLARWQAPHPLCSLGNNPPVQLLLHVYPCSIISVSSSWTSQQSAALCTALASCVAATGWLKKLSSLITYMT
jgi:hypothetical protein